MGKTSYRSGHLAYRVGLTVHTARLAAVPLVALLLPFRAHGKETCLPGLAMASDVVNMSVFEILVLTHRMDAVIETLVMTHRIYVLGERDAS